MPCLLPLQHGARAPALPLMVPRALPVYRRSATYAQGPSRSSDPHTPSVRMHRPGCSIPTR